MDSRTPAPSFPGWTIAPFRSRRDFAIMAYIPAPLLTRRRNPVFEAPGPLLIDLHTHSYPSSDDSFVGIDDLIERARSLGLDGICLTDHDFFWSAEKVRELSRRHDFLLLPGSEINTDMGHVIVFGLDKYIFGLHKPPFLREELRRRGGVAIAAHPYRRRFLEDPGRDPAARAEMLERAGRDEFFNFCAAIEGVNGRGADVQNEFSQDLSAMLGLPMTGGSDAHRAEQVGTAATRFEREIASLEDLIRELKAGRFHAERMRSAAAPVGGDG